MKYEVLTWIAAVSELSGLFLLSRYNRLGFICNIMAAGLWISYSITTKSAFGLIGVCSVALILNVSGYRRWKSEAAKKAQVQWN